MNVLAFLMIHTDLKEEQSYHDYINLTGRQRTLVEKMTDEAALILKSDSSDIQRDLANDAVLFDKTFQGFRLGDEELGVEAIRNSEIITEMAKGQEIGNEFYKNIRIVISQSSWDDKNRSFNYINNENQTLLQEMDKITGVFETESQRLLNEIIFIQVAITIANFLLLALAWILAEVKVLKPLEKMTMELAHNEVASAILKDDNLNLAKPKDEIKLLLDGICIITDNLEELEILSSTDALTGLLNRRKFEEKINEEWNRCKRYAVPISIIMMDIDYYKQYNDNYGHQAGDKCLKQVSEVLLKYCRRSADFVARYGGDEFIMVLPHFDADETMILAEKIRQAIELLAIPHEYSKVSKHVTVSLGINTVIPSNKLSIESFIKEVDIALYKAKRKSRNCVIAIESE